MGHVTYYSECRCEKTECIYHMLFHSFVCYAPYVLANVLSRQKTSEKLNEIFVQMILK